MTNLKVLFQRPPAAHDEVLRQLRLAIVQGRLKPGEQLRQEQLAQSFGLSRVPIREALKTLAGERLVSHEPNRGFFVTRLSIDELSEIYRARDLLECEIVTAAESDALVTIADKLQRLQLSIEATRKKGDYEDFAAANREFHFMIFGCSVRPFLTDLVRQLWDSSEVYRTVIFAGANRLERINLEHQLMIDAILTKDRQTLADLLQGHRSAAITVMQDVLAATND